MQSWWGLSGGRGGLPGACCFVCCVGLLGLVEFGGVEYGVERPLQIQLQKRSSSSDLEWNSRSGLQNAEWNSHWKDASRQEPPGQSIGSIMSSSIRIEGYGGDTYDVVTGTELNYRN